MKESIGMVPTIAIVMAAFVLITSYLAFTINSNKAYKANSRIVNLIEKYDNANVENHAGLNKEIQEYLNQIGYSVTDMSRKCKEKGWKKVSNQGWCYKIVYSVGDADSKGDKVFYTKVKTFVSVDVPIFDRIFSDLEPFEINGSTKTTTIK